MPMITGHIYTGAQGYIIVMDQCNGIHLGTIFLYGVELTGTCIIAVVIVMIAKCSEFTMSINSLQLKILQLSKVDE